MIAVFDCIDEAVKHRSRNRVSFTECPSFVDYFVLEFGFLKLVGDCLLSPLTTVLSLVLGKDVFLISHKNSSLYSPIN